MAKITKTIASKTAMFIVDREFNPQFQVLRKEIIDLTRKMWSKYGVDEHTKEMANQVASYVEKGYKYNIAPKLPLSLDLSELCLDTVTIELKNTSNYVSLVNEPGFDLRLQDPYESAVSLTCGEGGRWTNVSRLLAKSIVDEVTKQACYDMFTIVSGKISHYNTLVEQAKDRFAEIRRTLMSFGTDKKLFASMPELADLPPLKALETPQATSTVSLKEIDSIRDSVKVILGINNQPTTEGEK